ncbi:MAG: class I SAM-dependent methyltransferase [Limisphaerales bacterium]
MQPSSKQAVKNYLAGRKFESVLDVPSGGGWLRDALAQHTPIDGIDLYVAEQDGYRKFWAHDLEDGLPEDCRDYDLICCCEGIEHVGSPLLLLRHFHKALRDNGTLIISTPNVWYPQARLQYFLRGFFPSFPPLADKVKPGTHMHITPWSIPQLYVYLKLAGFSAPKIVPEPGYRTRIHERVLQWPAKLYCRGKLRRAKNDEERAYWEAAGSPESILSRHLIVAASKS